MLLLNKRIFIVEDNVANRAIMQLLLEEAGAEVYFEHWGTDVLRRLRNYVPIDAILLDLNFPRGISGYDVYDAIRGVPEYRDIPVVAVSATDPSQAMPKTREKGFAGFIAKPIDHDQFPEQIATVVNGNSLWSDV